MLLVLIMCVYLTYQLKQTTRTNGKDNITQALQRTKSKRYYLRISN